MKRLFLGGIIGAVLVTHPQYLAYLNPANLGPVVQQVGSAAVGLVNQAAGSIHR
jgi:hypothetical protein